MTIWISVVQTLRIFQEYSAERPRDHYTQYENGMKSIKKIKKIEKRKNKNKNIRGQDQMNHSESTHTTRHLVRQGDTGGATPGCSTLPTYTIQLNDSTAPGWRVARPSPHSSGPKRSMSLSGRRSKLTETLGGVRSIVYRLSRSIVVLAPTQGRPAEPYFCIQYFQPQTHPSAHHPGCPSLEPGRKLWIELHMIDGFGDAMTNSCATAVDNLFTSRSKSSVRRNVLGQEFIYILVFCPSLIVKRQCQPSHVTLSGGEPYRGSPSARQRSFQE